MSSGGSVPAAASRPTSSTSMSPMALPLSAASASGARKGVLPMPNIPMAARFTLPPPSSSTPQPAPVMAKSPKRRATGALGRAGPGPAWDGAGLPLDAAQLLNPLEIDAVVEPGQPQGHDRHQALAPGEHLGLIAEVAQQPDHVRHLLGGVVLEGG